MVQAIKIITKKQRLEWYRLSSLCWFCSTQAVFRQAYPHSNPAPFISPRGVPA